MPACPFKKDSCGHVDSGDVIRAKQQPTEELQRTEEYTKADNGLSHNLAPLLLYPIEYEAAAHRGVMPRRAPVGDLGPPASLPTRGG